MTIDPKEVPAMPDGYIMTEEDYRHSASNLLAICVLALTNKAEQTVEYEECRSYLSLGTKFCRRGCELVEPILGKWECRELYKNYVNHAKELLEERKTEE